MSRREHATQIAKDDIANGSTTDLATLVDRYLRWLEELETAISHQPKE